MDNINTNSRLVFITAATVGIGTVFFIICLWWSQKSKKEKPPSKWKKVGELCDLVTFPIKSLGPTRMNSFECTPLGLKSGWLRDRTLMVVQTNGNFVTGRQHPRLVKISPSFSSSVLKLNAPGMMEISVDLARLYKKGNYLQTKCWGQAVLSCDCGEQVARWISRFVLQENDGLRLVYYPLDQTPREISKKNDYYHVTEKQDTGVYPDATSYCLINEASVMDLNNRLEEPVTPQTFRPNFVVRGSEAYDEDNWQWVKVGQVIFRNVRPCTRCLFTTVDPETGIKNPKVEPLKTLKGYRQIEDPVLRPLAGDSPVMGIHLGLRGSSGKSVKLGEPVYVGVVDDDELPVIAPP